MLVGAMITLAPIGAAALSYESIITFTPQGDATDGQGPTSTDEADGNRIVVRFETPLNTGVVEFDDLDFLSITLFGSEGFIFEDVAIVDGMATPLGGVQREQHSFFFAPAWNPAYLIVSQTPASSPAVLAPVCGHSLSKTGHSSSQTMQ